MIEEKKVETVQEPEPMEVDSAIVEPAIEAEKMAVEEVPEKVPEKIEEPVIAAPEKIEEPVVVPEVSNVIPDAPVEPIVEPVIEPVIAEIEKETEMPKEPETTQTEPIAEKVETAPMIPEVITEDKVEDSPKDLSVAAPKMDSAPVIEKIDEIVPEKVEEPTKAVEEPVVEVLKPEEPKVDVESTTPEVVEPLIEPAVTIEKVEETKEKAIETNGTNGTKAEEKTTVNGNEEKETPEQKTNGSSEHKAQKEASENGSANGDSHTNGKEDIIDANEPVAASKDIEEPVVTPADLKAKLAEAQPPSVPVASES